MSIPSSQTAALIPATGASPTARLQIRHDHPVPSPTEGQILVKLEYSGVCHSDVHSVRGETPMLTDVAGHEGVGKVVKGRYLTSFPMASVLLVNLVSPLTGIWHSGQWA